MGDFVSLCVLAWIGLYDCFWDLVFTCFCASFLTNQVLGFGCFDAFLAKFIANFTRRTLSLSRANTYIRVFQKNTFSK